MARSIVALALIALLAACNVPISAPSARTELTSTPRLPAARSATPAPYVFADCTQAANIYSWQDLDRDGFPGLDEPPLPGVPVELQGWFSGKWRTDERGKASAFAISGCPLPDLVAVAESPPGFTPTTPLRVSFASPVDSVSMHFGFAKDTP